MNTSNQVFKNDKNNKEVVSDNTRQHQQQIESIVKSMAKEYFPEFILPEADVKHTASQASLFEESKASQIAEYKAPKEFLSEEDFIQAIPNVSNLFDEPINFSESSATNSLSYTIEKKKVLESCAESFWADGELNSGDPSNLILSPILVPDIKSSNDPFDIKTIRKDFPILSEKVGGKDLIWFDNAATTQKPKTVIERLKYYYEHENSNVHRAAHTLAARTTDAYEGVREKIASFLHAADSDEIVFVRGTTEAINLVAQTFGVQNLSKDDEIIVSMLEHHANIVPWQMVCAKTGAKLRIIPVDENGQVVLSEYEKLLGPKTKIVSFTHVSNALGTITPVAEMINMAHRYGAKVLVDGAQAVAHLKVDVQELDCDFYVFSSHKIFGPTGVGVLYAKANILNTMQPYQGGGSMISDVTFEQTTYKSAPHRFEAGTGSIADAIGLGAAIDYITNIGIEHIFQYEHQLLEYGIESLQSIPGLLLIGTAKQKTSILSFTLKGFKTEDVGKALNNEGIAVRAGHHCAQPILRRYGLESTVRVSLAFYNTQEEIDFLTSVILKLVNSYRFG